LTLNGNSQNHGEAKIMMKIMFTKYANHIRSLTN
jgi:hypothetical protein